MYVKPFTAVIVSNNANFKPFDVGSLFYHQTHKLFSRDLFLYKHQLSLNRIQLIITFFLLDFNHFLFLIDRFFSK